MEMILKVLTVLCLLLIFFEDIKSRMVSVYALVILGLLLILQNQLLPEFIVQMIGYTSINIIYLFTLAGCAAIYFRITGRKWQTLIESFGAGDALFLLACSCWFNPVIFVLFITASCICALIAHAIFRSVGAHLYGDLKKIPLAGVQSLVLIPVFLLDLGSVA